MTSEEIEKLLDHLESYSAQMAPHQREREGGQLIMESIRAIKSQQQTINSLDYTKSRFNPPR